jgi:cellobiose phosphorylase
MMSAITPILTGDIKAGQHAFLTLPVSVEDLQNSRSARNFWIAGEGKALWSASGSSALQMTQHWSDTDRERVTLKAGLLWHSVTRKNSDLGLQAQITNFVPANGHRVELMKVTITNLGPSALRIAPTAAVPIYGRSADNLRDHRHVTSLLHRILCQPHGVLVQPTLTFDERGHRSNTLTYAVLGVEQDGTAPVGFFPVSQDFCGEGGDPAWPEAVVRSRPVAARPGDRGVGYEAMGALRFREVVLTPGRSRAYVLILAILDETEPVEDLVAAYGFEERFDYWLAQTKQYWQKQLDGALFCTGDTRFDLWLRWVALQPTLRRLFGNSFLPYHDYGRGGRGWRDLWQDLLSLLIMDVGDFSPRLLGHFAGVRMDGSNATIIGTQPGEFRADRNNIPRVWMDHGAWPLLTVGLYIDQTGDLRFLLREQTYFKDHLSDRSRHVDETWQPEQGTVLRTAAGEPYLGTVLEHLLIQHLTAFFNAGEHGSILLEDADWNDGLDMASRRGESVAFTALYAGNLRRLADLVLALEGNGTRKVELAEEVLLLLDSLGDAVDYELPAARRQRLDAYFQVIRYGVSGRQVSLTLTDLAQDLNRKADWLTDHLRRREWVRSRAGYGWYNGYYDDDGQRVEGDFPHGTRMTLTAQVFALMGKVASEEQAREIVRAADHYLFDPIVGGYRLNTDFGQVLLSLGRAFGFAYGHKENGAMFSHMAVMYANALYQHGLAREGWRVLESIYQQSQDFSVSRMYPGIPEYFNDRGRGMYPYLTGSASWYLLTMVREVFGVKGVLGDLRLEPQLLANQFDANGQASLRTRFAGRNLTVVYHNDQRLDYGTYRVGSPAVDGQPVAVTGNLESVTLPRALLAGRASDQHVRIDVPLVRR